MFGRMKSKVRPLPERIVFFFIGRGIELSPLFLKIPQLSMIVMSPTVSRDLAGIAGCFWIYLFS